MIIANPCSILLELLKSRVKVGLFHYTDTCFNSLHGRRAVRGLSPQGGVERLTVYRAYTVGSRLEQSSQTETEENRGNKKGFLLFIITLIWMSVGWFGV